MVEVNDKQSISQYLKLVKWMPEKFLQSASSTSVAAVALLVAVVLVMGMPCSSLYSIRSSVLWHIIIPKSDNRATVVEKRKTKRQNGVHSKSQISDSVVSHGQPEDRASSPLSLPALCAVIFLSVSLSCIVISVCRSHSQYCVLCDMAKKHDTP
jgi:hypothetical protein